MPRAIAWKYGPAFEVLRQSGEGLRLQISPVWKPSRCILASVAGPTP